VTNVFNAFDVTGENHGTFEAARIFNIQTRHMNINSGAPADISGMRRRGGGYSNVTALYQLLSTSDAESRLPDIFRVPETGFYLRPASGKRD
jgi:hypothetical protein